MSKKVHFKVIGVDCRDHGQTTHEYENQAICGFAGVTVVKKIADVTCKKCLSKIKKEEYSDEDDTHYDCSM